MRATLNGTFTTKIRQQGLTWAETRGPRQGTERRHESVDFPDFALPFGHDFDAMSLLIRFYSQSSCDRELSLFKFPKLSIVPPSLRMPLCKKRSFSGEPPSLPKSIADSAWLLAAARCSVTRVSKPSLHFSFTVRKQKNML